MFSPAISVKFLCIASSSLHGFNSLKKTIKNLYARPVTLRFQKGFNLVYKKNQVACWTSGSRIYCNKDTKYAQLFLAGYKKWAAYSN